jgi:hypothetical protein
MVNETYREREKVCAEFLPQVGGPDGLRRLDRAFPLPPEEANPKQINPFYIVTGIALVTFAGQPHNTSEQTIALLQEAQKLDPRFIVAVVAGLAAAAVEYLQNPKDLKQILGSATAGVIVGWAGTDLYTNRQEILANPLEQLTDRLGIYALAIGTKILLGNLASGAKEGLKRVIPSREERMARKEAQRAEDQKAKNFYKLFRDATANNPRAIRLLAETLGIKSNNKILAELIEQFRKADSESRGQDFVKDLLTSGREN